MIPAHALGQVFEHQGCFLESAMPTASILAIYLHAAKGAPLFTADEVKAVPRCGLEGDRLFSPTPGHLNLDQEVTLIESEAIEAVAAERSIHLAPGEARRNLLTQGVRLNELVDREFEVGPVRLKGLRLCQPCDHLESLTQPGVKAAFRDRCGLRAQILTSGVIRVGDLIRS
jgi:MOSC domain-containing protein YiiM